MLGSYPIQVPSPVEIDMRFVSRSRLIGPPRGAGLNAVYHLVNGETWQQVDTRTIFFGVAAEVEIWEQGGRHYLKAVGGDETVEVRRRWRGGSRRAPDAPRREEDRHVRPADGPRRETDDADVIDADFELRDGKVVGA